MNKREALIEKIRHQGLPLLSAPSPVVSLEDFFEGNDDYGSIGCSLINHPGPQYFFEHLLAIPLGGASKPSASPHLGGAAYLAPRYAVCAEGECER